MKWTKSFIIILFLFLGGCEKLEHWARESWKKRSQTRPVATREIEEWKEKLALNEAEIKELDKAIAQMVQKTKLAGGVSWKIAQAYMKVGDYELGIRYYNQALQENTGKKVEVISSEVHFFESAIPYFDKTLIYKSPDKQLLFEAGLAYANAARDRGWEATRRSLAIDIFEALARMDPEDSRFPYELALIYVDSSRGTGWDGIDARYFDHEKGMRLLNSIIQKEPRNIPARFARANFLYQAGQEGAARTEYLTIKKLIESMTEEGLIKEPLPENQSYKNVINNLKTINSNDASK